MLYFSPVKRERYQELRNWMNVLQWMLARLNNAIQYRIENYSIKEEPSHNNRCSMWSMKNLFFWKKIWRMWMLVLHSVSYISFFFSHAFDWLSISYIFSVLSITIIMPQKNSMIDVCVCTYICSYFAVLMLFMFSIGTKSFNSAIGCFIWNSK